MNSEKLNEIGEKLEVTPEDTARLRKRKLLMRIFAPVIGALAILASLVGGLSLKRGTSSYPYGSSSSSPVICGITGLVSLVSMGVLVAMVGKSRKDRLPYKFLIGVVAVTFFLSIIAFITGSAVGEDNFSGAPKYGVYSRGVGR